MKFLCLDLGLNTGFCIANDENDEIVSGVLPLRIDKKEHPGKKYDVFYRFLEKINPDHVIFERAQGMKGKAADSFSAYAGLIEFYCYRNNKGFQWFPQSVIKKAATGKGDAKKKEIVKAVNKYFGLNITNHNEADAVAVWICYLKLN